MSTLEQAVEQAQADDRAAQDRYLAALKAATAASWNAYVAREAKSPDYPRLRQEDRAADQRLQEAQRKCDEARAKRDALRCLLRVRDAYPLGPEDCDRCWATSQQCWRAPLVSA